MDLETRLEGPVSTAFYRPVSLRALQPLGRHFDGAALLVAWLATLALGIGLGLASIAYDWSGLPLHLGGVDLYITIYPPLIFSTLWVLWFGFWWGFVPAYLATLVLALYSGMPLAWALLFAFADPLSLAVLAIAYRAIPIRYDLRSSNALAFFVLISFVGSIFGATGSFIWTHTNALGVHDLLPIWQGWWLGNLLQNLLLVAPLLYLFSPMISRWRERHLGVITVRARETRGTLLAGGTIIAGVLLYLHFTIALSHHRLESALAGDDTAAWRAAALANAEATTMLYWAVVILILFIAFFGTQLFVHWTRSLQQSARELSSTNVRLRREMDQREEAEQELRQTADRLATANASKDRLFSIVAHDLRGPVSAIGSLLNILDSQVREQGQRELIERFANLREAMQQLTRFLENLLQWSRLQLDQDQCQPQVVDLARAVDSAAGPSALHASLKEITVERRVTPDTLVLADPHMLQTILHNLLSNAIKFTPRKGYVTVTAAREHLDIHVTVRDTGIGIEADKLSQLFDIARLSSRPGTNGEPGSGLGLLLCKELVERQGGHLWVESWPHTGTEVHFTLPAVRN
ncbi:sensor histidine kinase [Sulfurivermis fontis]|uniref:sensor histidine kinase n=1 Tax=Sulfurivermis fontis TaxID=1972068 RepID=UPI00155911B6|nr:HAMP domain-containing sensor histidine kinase [Sulfurivermis fontis]